MNHPQEQGLIEHLSELRTRLIYAVLGIAVGMAICWNFSTEIMKLIRHPIEPYLPQGGLIFTGVMDKFMAHIKVALLGGVILSCPFWIFQLWKFVAPGLFESERKYAGAFIFTGSFLFLVGVSFVYFFVYPVAFEFLMGFGGDADKPMISIAEYLSFFMMTTLMFGLAFEMPLILVLLALMGLIDAPFLRKHRRYAVVVMAFFAAILTPPDVISMTMMLIPLMFLYESAIIAIVVIVRKREKLAS
jgi:sec-independent protein translocase protein TatC